jgi:hypothetical protein
MTKEEYKAETERLLAALESLKDIYIEEHHPCEVGQKISVKDGLKRVEGIVTGFKIGWDLKVEIIAYKLKKNGKPSEHRLYIYTDSDLQFTH